MNRTHRGGQRTPAQNPLSILALVLARFQRRLQPSPVFTRRLWGRLDFRLSVSHNPVAQSHRPQPMQVSRVVPNLVDCRVRIRLQVHAVRDDHMARVARYVFARKLALPGVGRELEFRV